MQPNMNCNTQLSDQQMLEDLLSRAKQLVSIYSTAITESGTPTMRQAFQKNLNTCLAGQYNLYTQMKNQGFYQVKTAQPADIAQAVQKFSKARNDM